MNEDQTPQEIVAEVKEVVTRVWTGDQAEVSFNGARLNDVREIVVSPKQHAKLADRAPDVARLKEELRLKMAARYGNRHDRRQAVSLARKARTKARHLARKKAVQKGTHVAATPLPAGAHQPSSKALKRELRKLGQETGIDFELGTVMV